MFMEIRSEINHLLYLYFNSIGVIQRDCAKDSIHAQIEEMAAEIKTCAKRICGTLDAASCAQKKDADAPADKQTLGDGLAFVDWWVAQCRAG